MGESEGLEQGLEKPFVIIIFCVQIMVGGKINHIRSQFIKIVSRTMQVGVTSRVGLITTFIALLPFLRRSLI